MGLIDYGQTGTTQISDTQWRLLDWYLVSAYMALLVGPLRYEKGSDRERGPATAPEEGRADG